MELDKKVDINELYSRVEECISKLSNITEKEFLAFIPTLKKNMELLNESLAKCIDLQMELHKCSDEPLELLALKKKVLDLENQTSHVMKTFMYTRTVVVVSSVGLFVILPLILLSVWMNLPYLFREHLDLVELQKSIILAIAGAFLYLATSALANIDQKSTISKNFAGVVKFVLQLSLAVIVPTVLVILVFEPSVLPVGATSVKEASTSEILSFACGYSAKLVVDILNKIVEKGTKMIETI